jgi:hypothetical protein
MPTKLGFHSMSEERRYRIQMRDHSTDRLYDNVQHRLEGVRNIARELLKERGEIVTVFLTVEVTANKRDFRDGEASEDGGDSLIALIRDELTANLEEAGADAVMFIDEGDTAPGCAECNKEKR